MDTRDPQPSDDEAASAPVDDESVGAPPVDDPDGEPELEDDDGDPDEEHGDEPDLTRGELGGYDEDDDQEHALSGRVGPAAPPADLEALVHYVVAKLVSDPQAIEIASEQRGGTVYLALRVPESDLGRVIGREGRTAKAIRTLVSIAGSKSHLHARLDIDG